MNTVARPLSTGRLPATRELFGGAQLSVFHNQAGSFMLRFAWGDRAEVDAVLIVMMRTETAVAWLGRSLRLCGVRWILWLGNW